MTRLERTIEAALTEFLRSVGADVRTVAGESDVEVVYYADNAIRRSFEEVRIDEAAKAIALELEHAGLLPHVQAQSIRGAKE